ncbi:RNA polymerase sigma factor [Amycolatopsis sp. MtRt-6]|uniref:RNA polymerase sigma factor n=1 Tax=Amycolatopsis sp. MtRt-6 TaxID=2792782 RepID=UPI001A8EAAC5|nr:sigma-70 family RNA polymerase sigma factor [Amycolatopsis sp. MtRt-6]
MTDVERLLRELAPQVLAALVRRYGDFDTCEDAVQEALLAASRQWPSEGLPDHPKGWLITTASRRRIEQWRSEAARQRREETFVLAEPPAPEPVSGVDDTLTLLLLCCHPSLTPPSQVALTLRAVGGLTTAEIARAFLVPEATIGQRISRAKQKLKGERLTNDQRPERLAAVLQVLYLIFTEGHTASSGDALNRVELTTEAIRLVRQLRAELPDDGEVTGLLALMLLTDARRPARVDDAGALVPLAEQDRSRWNRAFVDEGVSLITKALATTPVGPYQLQAAIAAVHDEAPTAEATDWAEILTLYDLLRVVAPGPMVTLNRVVAFAQVHGPEKGLTELAEAAKDLAGHHRVDAIRAHLLENAGDPAGAREAYLAAARRTLSLPEQAYLQSRAAKLET